MPFSSSNTGSTDLRDTEVQQPNTAAHLSTDSRPRAFSANSGQFEAGSTTTASSFRPSTPPFLFCSSISISMTSFSVVSLIAMVPESECRMPTLIGPVPCARGRRECRPDAAHGGERRGGGAKSAEAAAGERGVGDAMSLSPVRSSVARRLPRIARCRVQPPCHETVVWPRMQRHLNAAV